MFEEAFDVTLHGPASTKCIFTLELKSNIKFVSINLNIVCYIFWVIWIQERNIGLANLKKVCYILKVFDVYPYLSNISKMCCVLHWCPMKKMILFKDAQSISKQTALIINRRKFRSETSDNMDSWKAEVRRVRREKIRRKKMQVREKVGTSWNTESRDSLCFSNDLWLRRVEK